jgi:signal transduction histidine kinase/ActR/RegA family two-component response regulator/HAMP domain-containing protein
LFAIILLALAPALMLVLRTHAEQSQAVRQRSYEDARRLVHLAALDQDRVLDGTRQLLTALAQLPEVRGEQWDNCTKLFGELFERYEGYTNMGVADQNGDVMCAAIPNEQRVNITDREYFQRTMATQAFSVGKYQIGRTSRQPNLGSGYPVFDNEGAVKAVAWASRDLSWMNQHAAAVSLPPGAAVTVLDSDGTVLARQPNPEAWVGSTMADAPLIRTIIQRGQGTETLPGLDGVPRIYAFSDLASTGGTAFISVGLSEATVAAEADRLLEDNLLGLAAAAVMALLLAGIGGELFLMRRVRRLTRVAERLRAGDLTARVGGSRPRDELSQLASTLDSMTEALAERTDNLSRTNARLQEELAERARNAEERAHLIGQLELRGNELEARFRELALIHEISQSMLKTSDLSAFLEASLDRIMPLGPYDIGVIRLLDASRQRVEHLVSRGYRDPVNIPGIGAMAGDRSSRANFRSLAFDRAQAMPDLAAGEGYRSFKREGICSLVSVPIRTADEMLGFFNVGTRTLRDFAEPEVRLLDSIGAQLGVAAQKARFYDELRRSEEQLRQAQKMEAVGVLAGGIAHDFNNLLTAISGFSELLLADPEPGTRRAYLEEIIKAGQRATALTSQLLAFSRLQLLQPEVLDLNQVIDDMDLLLRRVIGEDIDVVMVADPNLSTVRADPGQIAQVLMNLAANARDAMPTGGTLTIATTNVELDESTDGVLQPGSYVRLSVSDSGNGMDAATLQRIFEPFYTTKERGKGTGLGLATVYGIIKQSGGDIQVQSQLGQGTIFSMYLPAYGAIAEPVSAELSPLPAQGSETILLVEDEDPVRRLVEQLLATAGYTVFTASHGAEALEVAAQQDSRGIDLLLTDIVMPGMSGRELAVQLTSRRPEVRVLYMSGYTPDVAIRHGVLEASVAYLQKPFAPGDLLQKVREVLDAEPSLAVA